MVRSGQTTMRRARMRATGWVQRPTKRRRAARSWVAPIKRPAAG
jgi:hypothetical protein